MEKQRLEELKRRLVDSVNIELFGWIVMLFSLFGGWFNVFWGELSNAILCFVMAIGNAVVLKVVKKYG